MITIIHGEDNAASRKFFHTFVEKEENAKLFDGTKITITDVVQIIDGSGLFGDTVTLYIEDFLSKRKTSKDVDEIISYLLAHEKETNIFFWESKDLTKKTLSLFPKATVKQFSLPKTLFAFLNALTPGNGSQLIKLFHQTVETSEPELVFFMLLRQFRLLLALSDTNLENIEEAARLAPWQRGNLEKQARSFSDEKLKELYHKLYQIDLGQKTGTLGMTLTQAIDFFLTDI